MISGKFAWGVAALAVVCSMTSAQQVPWTKATLETLTKEMPAAHLTKPQRQALEGQIRVAAAYGIWQCNEEDLKELWEGLTFNEIRLRPKAHTVLLTAGPGCARGGQGSNGTMWLFEMRGDRAVSLGQIDGWGPGVLPEVHAGYHDLVTGWHMSAQETDLTYYRFDGKSYQAIDHAVAIMGEGGNWKSITPARATAKH